jgi:hypothetical protein
LRKSSAGLALRGVGGAVQIGGSLVLATAAEFGDDANVSGDVIAD